MNMSAAEVDAFTQRKVTVECEDDGEEYTHRKKKARKLWARRSLLFFFKVIFSEMIFF